MLKKGVAELIGTMALIFVGAGSICANNLDPKIGLVGIALAHGLTFAVMVSALGHISGGHFNPAITIGVWVARKIPTGQALAYWIFQLAGAALGAWLLTRVFPTETWRAVSLGTPDLAPGITRGPAILAEGLMTFFLVFVVFATAIDGRGAFKAIAGFGIGLTITFDMLVGGPLTGAAMNPARAFGPALMARYWANHAVYWVGPLLGGVVAGALYSNLFLEKSK
jgi:aquaporin Z